MRILFIFLFTAILTQVSLAKNVNILDFGAMPDSSTINTIAIQKAIDHCYGQGGGEVVIPSGKFVSGTIILRSNIFLHLEAGALLVGSVDLKDFPENIPGIRSYTDNYTRRSLIYAENVDNIGITGMGTLDGRGWHGNFQGKPYLERPYMIRMIGCRNIIIRDITLRDSPMWVQHYLACDDLVIDAITVDSRTANHNNDGIDIDGCQNVRISNCLVNSLDDALVLKSTLKRKCSNIAVTNCILSSHCNAFKMGTESNGGFENIVFNNSIIRNTRLSGIALEVVDGGSMRNISISNIIMDSLYNPLFIRLGNRARPYTSGIPEPGIGTMEGITIDGIRATNIGRYQQTGEDGVATDPDWEFIPASISGLPTHRPTDIVIKNVIFEFPGGYKSVVEPEEVALNEASYPEFRCMGILPASVLYVRNVNGLLLEGWVLRVLREDVRPCLFFDDVMKQSIDRISINGNPLNTNHVGFVNMSKHPLDNH